MTASESRARLYARMFGPAREVVRPRPPSAPAGLANSASPAIEISIHPPGHAGREFYTLITSGMSDRPMKVPHDDKGAARRVELAFYVDQPGPTVIALLQTLARMPHQQDLWLGHGHTLPNGDPPAPLFPSSQLSVILTLLSNVAPESALSTLFEIDGDPVSVLMPVPLTEAEWRLVVDEGLDALLARFNDERFSFVLDPGRASLV